MRIITHYGIIYRDIICRDMLMYIWMTVRMGAGQNEVMCLKCNLSLGQITCTNVLEISILHTLARVYTVYWQHCIRIPMLLSREHPNGNMISQDS